MSDNYDGLDYILKYGYICRKFSTKEFEEMIDNYFAKRQELEMQPNIEYQIDSDFVSSLLDTLEQNPKLLKRLIDLIFESPYVNLHLLEKNHNIEKPKTTSGESPLYILTTNDLGEPLIERDLPSNELTNTYVTINSSGLSQEDIINTINEALERERPTKL